MTFVDLTADKNGTRPEMSVALPTTRRRVLPMRNPSVNDLRPRSRHSATLLLAGRSQRYFVVNRNATAGKGSNFEPVGQSPLHGAKRLGHAPATGGPTRRRTRRPPVERSAKASSGRVSCGRS